MDNAFLAGLVEKINDHRTWIRAELSAECGIYHVMHGERERAVSGRWLLLTAYHPEDGYLAGQQWRIHECLLDLSVRRLRAFDTQFAFNYARRRLSLRQIERLIEESSEHLVHLRLDELGCLF